MQTIAVDPLVVHVQMKFTLALFFDISALSPPQSTLNAMLTIVVNFYTNSSVFFESSL